MQILLIEKSTRHIATCFDWFVRQVTLEQEKLLLLLAGTSSFRS